MTYKRAIIVAGASTVSATKFFSLFDQYFGGDIDWFVEEDYQEEGDECNLWSSPFDIWSSLGINLECREGLECRDQNDGLFDGFMSFAFDDDGFGICVDP